VSAPLVIVGAGGHGRETLSVARASGAWDPITFVDDGAVDRQRLHRIGGVLAGDVDTLVAHPADHVIAIGDPQVRRRVAERIGSHAPAATIVDPSVRLGDDVELAPGVIAHPRSVCTTNIRIGHHSHLNCGVVVSHDCRVGDFVSLSPGVLLNGDVVVEDDAFLGSGAVVLPGCRVGQGAIVGAGAVVRTDVDPYTTVVGVPAQRVERAITVITP